MKGVVFTIFSQMIEEQFGFETWDRLIESTAPESDGVYTSGDIYPDGELINYVGALAEITGAKADDLVVAFGRYMMQQFRASHPEYLEGVTAKEFLQNVHDTIHVDVRKLHPGAITPSFSYEDPAPDRLVMLYRSPRKMCKVAEGLIQGTAEAFDVEIAQKQTVCMHDGADHCRFELEFV